MLDQDWQTNDTFWKVFGGKENVKKVKSAEAGGKDENFWRQNRQNITLYRVSDASGKLQVTKIHQGALNPKLLETNVGVKIGAFRRFFRTLLLSTL